MDGQEVQLRALHSKFLDRQPTVEDLPEELRGVANACRIDEAHPFCEYGRENLSGQDWDRIRAAWAEDDRRAADQAEVQAACRRGDEAALRSMYPGHAAFYEMDASIDTGSFDSEFRRDSSFLREICSVGPDLWLDYEFYVTSLFPKG